MVCTTRAAYRKRARERRANRIKKLLKVEFVADNFFLVKFQSKMSSMGRGKEKAVDEDYGKLPPHIVHCFVNLMEAAIDRDSLKSNTFDPKTWSNFTVQMQLACGRSFTETQLKTKYQRLKAEWKVFSDMKKQSGFGWDEVNETVTCSQPVWEQYLKMHPTTKKYANKGLADFDALTKIMEESTAQGNVTRASTQRVLDDDEERRMNYEFGHPHQSNVHVLDDDDDVPLGSGSGSRKRKSGTSSGRGSAMSIVKDYISSCMETQEVKRSRLKNKIEVESNVSADPALAELDHCQDIISSMTWIDPNEAVKAIDHLIQHPRVCHSFLRMTPAHQEAWVNMYGR